MPKHIVADAIVPTGNPFRVDEYLSAITDVAETSYPVAKLPDTFVCEYCREGKHHKCFIKRCSCAHKKMP